MRWIILGLHWLGIVLIAHALMMLGADEIGTLERNVLTIHSTSTILMLYGLSPQLWVEAIPLWAAGILVKFLSFPAWAVLAVSGGAIEIYCSHNMA